MNKKILFSFLLAALCFSSRNSNAQVNALPFVASLDTFAPISGTTLDGPFQDDVAFNNHPIGFTFYLGGVAHTHFSATTNGYIGMDSGVAAYNYMNALSASASNKIIAPYGADLIHQLATASLQYTTLGTAPNRICVIQWLHYSYFGNSGDLNFQIWLYETSNCIRFVYGQNTLVATPLSTQIGLRGSSIADFIALGDTSCNWAFAAPGSLVTTHFPVSTACNMPSGFSFHFGGCPIGGSTNFAYMTGKVFNDLNNNGTLDAGEPGIANKVINMQPLNYYVSTDQSGNYAFFFNDSTQTYLLSTAGITYWTQINSPAVISCHPQVNPCGGLNFGFHMIPNVHEVQIHTLNWGAKPNQPEPMPIWYSNNGTTTESDSITFVMDPLYSFISATPAPAYVSGQTIKWAYSNLQPGHSAYINLHLLPSATAVLGNYLNSTLTIAPLNDTIPANNTQAVHQLITNAWDPNEKMVTPSGMIPVGTTLNYTVHFQNTGNAPAANVVVKDTLDSNLDPLTLQLTGYNYPVVMEVSGQGIVTFNFFNIQLPDSGSNWAASNGMVSFSIKTKSGLAPLTVMNNRAGIFFDFNPVVMTNMVSDTIEQLINGVDHIQAAFSSLAIPNPTAGNVVFHFSNNLKETADLKVMTLDGKVVMTKSNINALQSIDITSLPQGIYICSLHSASGTAMIKLVKE